MRSTARAPRSSRPRRYPRGTGSWTRPRCNRLPAVSPAGVANRPVFNPTQDLVMTDSCCCPAIPTSELLFPLELWDADTGDDIGTTGWRLNCGFWYPNGEGFVALQRRDRIRGSRPATVGGCRVSLRRARSHARRMGAATARKTTIERPPRSARLASGNVKPGRVMVPRGVQFPHRLIRRLPAALGGVESARER